MAHISYPNNPNYSKDGSNILIIYNPGGWGNTPLKEAEDFAPIIEGIQQILDKKGYNHTVLEYYRIENNLFGKIIGLRDFLSSFQFSSKILANKIKSLESELLESNTYVILAGLSNGAAFIDKTIRQIPKKYKIYSIEVGLPFWFDKFESKNILRIDNNGTDPLTKRRLDELIPNLIKSLFKFTFSRNGQRPSFAQALHVSGHDYSWNEINSKIESFLEDKLQNKEK